jgi:hypothetical protein
LPEGITAARTGRISLLTPDGNVIIHTLAMQPAAGSHSPDIGSHSTDLAPQSIRQSGTVNFASGVLTLEFRDGRATIGIDIGINNLAITHGPPGNSTPNPEPVTFALAGTGLAGIFFLRHRVRGQALASVDGPGAA